MISEKRVASILQAGGLISLKDTPPQDEPVDTVCARAYPHAALGERVVIRLSAQAMSEADDLEMEVLGFGPGEERAQIGQQRRKGLGFPGWALVHDPEHSRYALEVVKAFKKEARRARSKPGHAKTGIDEIGKQLGRSVPQFLPSFYEEAGRAFLENGNHQYAAQMFGKAREAEHVHALEIDEDQRRQSFLEFALSGAVTIKALTGYAKELEKSRSSEEAYGHFRELCVKRTQGGMPPWGGMARELRRLAKAARLDPQAEDAALLEEILESLALAKAPLEFWKAYQKPMEALVAQSPSIRGVLLNLFPTTETTDFDTWWLDFLERAGCLEALWNAATPAEAQPTKGPAAWLTKFAKHVDRGWRDGNTPAQIFSIVRQMADRLKAEAKPVTFAGDYGRLDLDLTDLALELGIPVASPDDEVGIDLEQWAEEAAEPERGRELIYLAADGRFDGLLDKAIEDDAGNPVFEAAAQGNQGLAKARQAWLMRLVTGLETRGLPDLEDRIQRLEAATSAATFAEFPETYAVLQKAQVLPALTRSLAGGLFDELGWPALEEAVEALDPQRQDKLQVGSTWPYLLLGNEIRVIVVGPAGRVLEHDLQLPKKCDLIELRYVNGQLLVGYRDDDGDLHGYWSGAPKKRFSLERDGWGEVSVGEYAVTLEDASVSEGGRAIQTGDTKVPERHLLFSDGETCWRNEWKGAKAMLQEFDPRTGQKGRFSLPRFLEEYVEPGKKLYLRQCRLIPLPQGVEETPLGGKDGMYGWRVRLESGEQDSDSDRDVVEAESIDGRRWSGSYDEDDRLPQGLLSLPGFTAPRLITGEGWSGWEAACEYELLDPEGLLVTTLKSKDRAYCLGTPLVPPLEFWHFFSVRDEKASQALRQLTSETVAELLATAVEAGEAEQIADQTRARCEQALPEKSHPRLVAGLVGLVSHGAEVKKRLDQLLKARDPERVSQVDLSGPALSDVALRKALGGLCDTGWGDGALGQQLHAVSQTFRGDPMPLAKSDISWWELVDRIGAVAFKAIARGTPDNHREALLQLLEVWAETIFAEPGDRIRVVEGQLVKKALPFPVQEEDYEAQGIGEHRGNVFYLACDSDAEDPDSDWVVVEYASSGKFHGLPKLKIDSEKRSTQGFGTAERLRQFVALARERGAMSWDPEIANQLHDRSGISTTEAALIWTDLTGCLESWAKNFLPKDLREELGLKVAKAALARDGLRQLDTTEILSVFDSSIPEDLSSYWQPLGSGLEDETSLVARLAQAWNQKFGKRVAFPDELLMAIDKDLSPDLAAFTMVQVIAEPGASKPLNRDGRWYFDDEGELECQEKEVFDEELLIATAQYLPYLFVSLPVGDPLRDGLPELLTRVRRRLAHPELLLGGISSGLDDCSEKKALAFVEALGGEKYHPGGKGGKRDKPVGRDTGELIAVRNDWGGVNMAFRPAQVRSYEKLRPFADAWGVSALHAAEQVGSEGFTALVERIGQTPVPEGGFEANPLHSVPVLVQEVGQAHDLNEDAAVLYLQILALANPTIKWIKRINDWKPARYKKAVQNLDQRKLVLSAKRARAGRSHFLPGGWEALKAPYPPIEAWKAPLYGLIQDPEDGITSPIGRLLPLEPLHQIFEKAWKRIQVGDLPAYEKVK